MIETKEQYERQLGRWRDVGEIDKGRHIRETIEALREVARAGRIAGRRLKIVQALGPVGRSPK